MHAVGRRDGPRPSSGRRREDRLAEAGAEASIELGAPGGRIYFDRGLVHESTGAFEQADQDFLKAYELDPNNAQIRDKALARGLVDQARD